MSADAKTLETILNTRLIGIIRLPSEAGLVDCVRALADGGLRAVEITMNTPGALQAIEAARSDLEEDVVIGAGTVLSAEDVGRAAGAGADFIVSPDTHPDVIAATRRAGLVSVPGALTPTEVTAATRHGADLVKLFPANRFGPGYLKELLAPLNKARLVPTGGVRLENLQDWFAAGAAAVALGSSLVAPALVEAKDWGKITASAQAFVEAVQGLGGGKAISNNEGDLPR